MTEIIVALLALLLISVWAGFYQLVKQQGRMLLRLDALEQHANPPVAPAETAHRKSEPEGLPLETEFPAFAFPDLAGKTVSLDEFRGRRVLLIHWNFGCGFCDSIASSLADLQSGLAGANVTPVLLAHGDAGANRQGAAEHRLRCPMLLIGDAEAPPPLRHQGTPVAYLLDERGRVDAPLASGADEVMALARALAGGPAQSPQAVEARHQVRVPHLSGKSVGLGDAIKRFTSALGIAPCAGCERRAALLNRWLSFSGAAGGGLKAGERAPDFHLPDLRGRMVGLENYRGRRVLLVFSDPQCGPCDELAPHLVRVHRQHQNNGLAVVLVVRGTTEENRRKAELHGFDFPVIVQPKWKLSKSYGILATPAAFLIGADGAVARDVAVGKDAVLALAQAGGQDE
jgi:peroxiredoxin